MKWFFSNWFTIFVLSTCSLTLIVILVCKPIGDKNEDFTIVTIDQCEYIKTHVYSGEVYTHKGNCKNPIHIYNSTK